MPKNILIFSDGTGQAGGLTPDQRLSNIYKMYRATRVGPDKDISPSDRSPSTILASAQRATPAAYR